PFDGAAGALPATAVQVGLVPVLKSGPMGLVLLQLGGSDRLPVDDGEGDLVVEVAVAVDGLAVRFADVDGRLEDPPGDVTRGVVLGVVAAEHFLEPRVDGGADGGFPV